MEAVLESFAKNLRSNSQISPSKLAWIEAVEKMTNSPLPSRILVTKNARLSTCQEGWGEDGHALTFPYLNNLKSYSAKSVIPKTLWRVDGNDTFWSGNAFVMFLEKVPWESAGTIFSCLFYVYCFIYLSICLFIYLFYVYILSVLCIGFPTENFRFSRAFGSCDCTPVTL